MADREPTTNNFSRAINLLRQATKILSSSELSENENNSSSSTPARPSSSSAQSQNTIPPIPTPDRDAAVMADFRNLFSPYAATTSSSLSRVQKSSRPPKRGSRPSPYFKPKETWTHDFFCLASPQQDQVPVKSQKLELQTAGLGRKKVVFGNKDQAIEVSKKLEAAYPKLKAGGGFEILRSGIGSSLAFVSPPATGYSVPYLRDQAGLGQALAYIRPLQVELDISPVSTDMVGANGIFWEKKLQG